MLRRQHDPSDHLARAQRFERGLRLRKRAFGERRGREPAAAGERHELVCLGKRAGLDAFDDQPGHLGHEPGVDVAEDAVGDALVDELPEPPGGEPAVDLVGLAGRAELGQVPGCRGGGSGAGGVSRAPG